MWDAFSDQRMGPSFTIVAGARQRSLSRIRDPRDSRTYIIVSGLSLPFSSPPTIHRDMVEVVCLCTCCLGNVHEPLPSKMGSSMSGSTIPLLGGVYLAVAWQWRAGSNSSIAAFRRHVTILNWSKKSKI
jgi:hypothetical protein